MGSICDVFRRPVVSDSDNLLSDSITFRLAFIGTWDVKILTCYRIMC